MSKLIFPLVVAGLCAAGVLLVELTADDAPPPVPAPAKAAPAKAAPPQYRSVNIPGVPHVRQKPDFCGEACAEMYLAKLGYQIDQDDVFDQAELDPLLGRGCYTRDLARSLPRIGFDVGPVWYQVAADRADTEIESQFRALHADLAAGVPSIVCMHYDDKPDATEHFRLVLGYDGQTDEVLYHEPAEANGAYRRMSREDFLKLWPLKYKEESWTLIRFRLAPVTIRNVHSTAKFTAADYAQRVMRVKKRAPEGFTILIQKPYVVVGDESPAEVRRWATGTIQWASDLLKQDYFTEDPDDILAIWLFKDKESYEKHTEELFDDTPDTPYGYVSYKHKAMIMNIGTGGGTLVHEIVHPYIASNFPNCPSWFNEGLGSLYEQCGEYRGRIWGRTNWRLEGLQKGITKKREEAARAANPEKAEEKPESDEAAEEAEEEEEYVGTVLPFRELCNTTSREFYYHDAGMHYAQARYLLYYLQQHNLLRTYYHEFHRNAGNDPSGYQTLMKVLGVETEAGMDKFQEDWEAWVMKLRYP
jgi:hypothetical protein